MPRKRKGGQSPARAPSGLPEGGSRGTSTGYRPSSMANKFTPGTSLSSSAEEDIVRNMKEMFSDLDPEVIYIVLSECDFKVENAMDSLLELSVAAADSGPILARVSGFERTAAALLSPHHFAEARSETDTAKPQLSSSSPTSFMTEDMDLLIDQEVQSLNAQQEVKGGHKSRQFSLTASHSQHMPLEALHLNSKQQCSGSSTEKQLQSLQIFGASSPLDQHSTFKDENSQGQEPVVDFKHLTTETPTDKNLPSVDLVALRRPSAFQVYTKQNPLNPLSEGAEDMASNATVGRTISKSITSNKKMDSSLSSSWNTDAPVFYPQVQENQGPAFITPVASNWPFEPRTVIPWHRPVSQAPLSLSAAIPRSWALPHPAPPPGQYSRLRLEGKVLVLLRGAPGAGKSTLARALLAYNPGGVILSTDDYFKVNEDYHFDSTVLGEAHSWNHNQAKIAFERGANPIIIDNTNMQGWEMKPYVVQALKHNYKVLFREPDTWWKNKPRELERRSTHGVRVETIRRMLDGYERFVTVQSIMGSQIPERKQQVATESRKQPGAIVPCPDLVGEPGQTDKNNKSHSQLISTLPDVSTVHDSNCSKSTQILQENTNMDTETLDTELDQQSVNQVIPDCIVESVINEDNCKDEMPVAFSESIRQRVRRERACRRPDSDSLEPAVVVKYTNHSDEDVRQKENTAEERAKSVEVKTLDFDGDWPSTGLLDQRQLRRHKRQHGKDNKDGEAKDNELGADNESTKNKDLSKSDITELQKLFDLIQTGAASINTDSSTLSSLSSSSDAELETDVKTDGRFEELQRLYDNVEQNLKEDKFKRVELPDCISDSKANETCITVRAPELDIEPTAGQHEINSNTSTENNEEIQDKEELCSSHVCQSLEFEGLVESESSLGEASGSQERKHRPIRRLGKQCKLALTFTQNCLESSVDSPECFAATAQDTDDPSLDLKPNIELCTEPGPKPDYEAPPSSFTQTESQDFALLWRVNHQNSLDTSVTEFSSNITVIYGDPTRFIPEMFCGTTAIQPTNHKEVPYHVLHEKSSQVVEKDLGTTQDQLDHLHILRRHFKLVTLDTLEDLYQKCQQDLEWTTNLLLDSGERFFRDDESEEEEDQSCARGGDEQVVNLRPCSDMLNVLQFKEQNSAGPDVVVEEIQQSNSAVCQPWSSSNTDSCGSITAPGLIPGTSVPQEKNNDSNETWLGTEERVPKSENKIDLSDNTQHKVTLQRDQEGGACGGSTSDAVGIEGLADEIQDDSCSMVEINRLLQAELEELDREEKHQEEERAKRQNVKEKRNQHIDIKSVELKLTTELALQLTELFGPVGVDPDTCFPEDCVLQMDLNLAKLLHQKWKESVQEKQKQAALSLQLLQESSAHWDNQELWPVEQSNPERFQVSTDGTPRDSRSDAGSRLPFMDHWNVSRPHVSLRNIIKEELVLQRNRETARQSQTVVAKRDGATLLKEDQLFARFPTIDRHFLQDIFRDNNYSLTQTELFLHSLLDEGPVKTVVAPEAPRITPHRAGSKDREKPVESVMPVYQDTEDPEYQDFRAEANLQRRRQLESFAKAAEAYKQGHKEVASFYAQQGHLHGQRMNEANHRAAVQIFERVNSSLLPQNILDLHGLHVDEALEHLNYVLEKKTRECEQGLCRPQLSVITGRGNHSLGGVARIRPAVRDYLTNKHYRFTEPKPGLVLVSLK